MHGGFPGKGLLTAVCPSVCPSVRLLVLELVGARRPDPAETFAGGSGPVQLTFISGIGPIGQCMAEKKGGKFKFGSVLWASVRPSVCMLHISSQALGPTLLKFSGGVRTMSRYAYF